MFLFTRPTHCRHELICSARKGYSQGRLFFGGYFTRDKTTFILQGIRFSGAKNKFRTGALPRIFNYSTEHLDLPSHYKYSPVSLLRIKMNSIILLRSKQIPQRNTSMPQESRYTFTRIFKFARVLWVFPLA